MYHKKCNLLLMEHSLWKYEKRDRRQIVDDQGRKGLDGASWTSATSSTAFSPRSGLGSILLNGKLWIFGGQAWSSLWKNDV
jgi:hypothetical protein